MNKARLGDHITTLPAAQMKSIDESIAISLDLIRYYNDEVNKYNRLRQYITQVKNDRNEAQDTLAQLKEIIIQSGFNDKSQEKIKEMLDIR